MNVWLGFTLLAKIIFYVASLSGDRATDDRKRTNRYGDEDKNATSFITKHNHYCAKHSRSQATEASDYDQACRDHFLTCP